MAMGKRKRKHRQQSMWIATQDLPRSASHPFYARLNRILARNGFDEYVEELCSAFYAPAMGRPSLAPGRYFRLLMLGFFEEIESESVKDLLGEGIRPDDLTYAIEFEVAGGSGHSVTLACPESALRSAAALQAALSSASATSGDTRTGDTSLEMLRVRVKKGMPKARLVGRALQGADASQAQIGTRKVWWGSRAGEARVYRWESLHPGNRVAGCAVLEGVNTTYFLPDGWTMTIDPYGNGKMTRA